MAWTWPLRTRIESPEEMGTARTQSSAVPSLIALSNRSGSVPSLRPTINRAPGDPPTPLHTGPTGPVYPKDDWTYTQAIAQYVDIAVGPVLIDMETFGIASTMRAAGLSDGVIVLRVVTDYLSDKPGQGDDQQLALLRGGSAKLAMVIADILGL